MQGCETMAKEVDKKALAKKDAKNNLNKKGKPKFSFKRWWRDMVAELRKVTWPTKKELINHTIIVVAFVAAMAVIVGLIDAGMSALIKLII